MSERCSPGETILFTVLIIKSLKHIYWISGQIDLIFEVLLTCCCSSHWPLINRLTLTAPVRKHLLTSFCSLLWLVTADLPRSWCRNEAWNFKQQFSSFSDHLTDLSNASPADYGRHVWFEPSLTWQVSVCHL